MKRPYPVPLHMRLLSCRASFLGFRAHDWRAKTAMENGVAFFFDTRVKYECARCGVRRYGNIRGNLQENHWRYELDVDIDEKLAAYANLLSPRR